MLICQFSQVLHNGLHMSVHARLLLKVSSLITCYNKRREPEALGLLLQLCKPPIIASILMLLETFECSDPLGLVLQKRDGSICLSDLPTYIEMMEHQLSKAKTTQK